METNKAMCCFCGKGDDVHKLILIRIPLDNEGGCQELLAHRKCLINVIHPQVPLHPSITDYIEME